MKKTLYVAAIALAFVACKEQEPKDYVTLSGTITDKNSDSLVVRSRTYQKKIDIGADGTFSDTLKVEKGTYNLFDGKESTTIFLENGFDIKLTLDTKQFDETITYSGIGEDVNNYLAKKALLQEKVLYNFDLYDLEKSDFEKETNTVFESMTALLESTKNLDSTFVAGQSKQIDGLKEYVVTNYEDKQYTKTVLAKGKPSPKFSNYENNAGGTTSIDDLKGKYLYVDVWATWCGPCKREIPFLKEVEKKYHGKNIEFVSISIDKQADKEKWKTMIAEKELGGTQLLADSDWRSKFVQDYKIKGIPRFILIAPDGNIVSADAPRPSDKRLIDLFAELKI
ncbi:TlpA family protein disulfide reductase [Snuella sedimenti]|uniref:TlpA family protein disulfide reductase n=1 Tax=Snuella sedimenti TaxID=2798802 RepID=A0A8J7LN05_9FLAO|nr:TlpA disulfide reductase family protein [Snuella sedimenti]MBJ6367288.1 TlpA family protein disulfide reductase [Snuella sedimenti]